MKAGGVIAEPEVTLTELSPADTFLVLASDGLWDVIPNDDAVGLVLDTGAPCYFFLLCLCIIFMSRMRRTC